MVIDDALLRQWKNPENGSVPLSKKYSSEPGERSGAKLE